MIDAQFQRIKMAVQSRWAYWLRCWLWRESIADLVQRVEEAPLSNERAQHRIKELEIALAASVAKNDFIPALETQRREAEEAKLEAMRVRQEAEIALEGTEKQLAEAKARSEADQRLREAAEDKAHRLEVELSHWKSEHGKRNEEVHQKHRQVANLTRFIFTSHRLDNPALDGTILSKLREAQSR